MCASVIHLAPKSSFAIAIYAQHQAYMSVVLNRVTALLGKPLGLGVPYLQIVKTLL
jgi:hypothetical protein